MLPIVVLEDFWLLFAGARGDCAGSVDEEWKEKAAPPLSIFWDCDCHLFIPGIHKYLLPAAAYETGRVSLWGGGWRDYISVVIVRLMATSAE